MTQPAAARKGKYGRRVYMIPRPGTKEIVELPAVSRVLDVLSKRGIEIWKQKMIAEQIAKRPDLQMLATTNTYEAAKQALSGGKERANVGDVIHSLSELVDDGTLREDLMHPSAKVWTDAYKAMKAAYDWEVVYKEVTIYNLELGYAGTIDRFMRSKLFGPGVYNSDLKTAKKVAADMALQLSMYVNGEGIWVPPPAHLLPEIEEDEKPPPGYWEAYAELGQHLPMPEGLNTDVGYIMHLAADLDDKGQVIEPVTHVTPAMVAMRLSRAWVVALMEVLHFNEAKDIITNTQVIDPGMAHSIDVRYHVVDAPTQADAIAFVTHDPSVNAPPAVPVIETGIPGVTPDSLRARACALPPVYAERVKALWPAGAPGLNKSGHTLEQLALIDVLLLRAEAAYQEEANRTAQVLSAFPGSTTE